MNSLVSQMQSKTEKGYIRELKNVYRKADRICKTNKDLDRETVVQTLFNLKQTPTERLWLALLRGGKINTQ